jgi:hypothetical protein
MVVHWEHLEHHVDIKQRRADALRRKGIDDDVVIACVMMA